LKAKIAARPALARIYLDAKGEPLAPGTMLRRPDLARTLARGPAFAHAMTKKMLEDEATLSLEAAIEAEAQAQAICMAHPDFREAYDGWVEKRAPRFEGLDADEDGA